MNAKQKATTCRKGESSPEQKPSLKHPKILEKTYSSRKEDFTTKTSAEYPQTTQKKRQRPQQETKKVKASNTTEDV
ncbi:hypothetical protein GDO81_025457 [Engystomops pustulosus]|uniref:Uncharacterized protein n=1 Tax=Engystomops pustulosus TaxID=76066 RepID=A0AAV6Z0F9_ENGPU|nr:hypothetical protein GDO81_025457 [Engystomops pustulosus]